MLVRNEDVTGIRKILKGNAWMVMKPLNLRSQCVRGRRSKRAEERLAAIARAYANADMGWGSARCAACRGAGQSR